MKFYNGIMRPGIVREVNSDGVLGNIRVSAPGLFSDQETDLSLLPPVRPLLNTHGNSYSSPSENSEVWVINFLDNPLQLYWIRKDTENFIPDNSGIIGDNETVEILVNRESGGNWAALYFTDGTGWVLGNGNSKIQIDKSGNIMLGIGSPYRTISITGSSISLGTDGGSAHPAAYGDSVRDSLLKISTLFQAIMNAASVSPYTAAIASAISSRISSYESSIDEITSPNVTLD